MGRQDLYLQSLSRRRLLGLGLGLGGAATLAACNVQVSSDTGATSGGLELPDSKAAITTEKVTFRWIDSGGQKAGFNKAVAKAYTAKHPNVTTDYVGQGWPVVNQTVTLGVRNGSAPDLFALPQSVPPSTAIEAGWVQPIEGLVPDFEAWKAAWPEGTFVPGIHSFGGKVYTLPLNGNRRLSQLVVYDVKSFEGAGLDPTRDLASWDAMRAAARTITQQGGGKTYGLILPGGQRLGKIVMELAVSAGWRSSETLDGLDYKTGEYIMNSPEILAGLEQLMGFVRDKSVFPGFLSLKNVDVTGRMPNGVAGMTFDGPWNLEAWAKENPGWKFDLVAQPPQEAGAKIYEPFQNVGANNLWAYSKSKNPQIAGDLMGYLGSKEGQTEMVRMTRGAMTSVFPDVTAAAKGFDLDPQAVKADALAQASMRACPIPSVRTAAAAQVLLELKTVKPNENDLMQGIVTGKVPDARKALTAYNDKLNRALDTAVAKAKAKGADVSRADFAFANWDVTKDYGPAQYKAL